MVNTALESLSKCLYYYIHTYLQLILISTFSSVGSDVSTLMVRCGEWDTQGDHEPVNHQDRFAQQVMLHPGYIKKNLNNDVAIIVMKEEFILDQHIDTICLPNQNDYSDINWQGCVATGW